MSKANIEKYYKEITFKVIKLLSARAAWAILHTGKTLIASQHVPQILEDS